MRLHELMGFRLEDRFRLVVRSTVSSRVIGVVFEGTWPTSAISRQHLRLLRRPRLAVVPNGSPVTGQQRLIAPLSGECAMQRKVADVGISVVGSLHECLPFWRDILKANNFVLDIIQHGYTIPFITEPPSAHACNNKSALKHSQFVRDAIRKLLVSNVVREIYTPPYCCNPLTVAEGKKLRLVLDLSRFVNPYVRYAHFKYEDWSVAEQVVHAGCWFFYLGFHFWLSSRVN